jgi:hypothetical protein
MVKLSMLTTPFWFETVGHFDRTSTAVLRIDGEEKMDSSNSNLFRRLLDAVRAQGFIPALTFIAVVAAAVNAETARRRAEHDSTGVCAESIKLSDTAPGIIECLHAVSFAM